MMLIIIGLAAFFGMACNRLALQKGHDTGLWTLLGLIFGVFSWIMLVSLPDGEGF